MEILYKKSFLRQLKHLNTKILLKDKEVDLLVDSKMQKVIKQQAQIISVFQIYRANNNRMKIVGE